MSGGEEAPDSSAEVDAAAERFLEELQEGKAPSRSEYVKAHPGLGKALSRRLALVERLHRARRDPPTRAAARAPAHVHCPHCGAPVDLAPMRSGEALAWRQALKWRLLLEEAERAAAEPP